MSGWVAAVTGGVASGKSAVSERFAALGIVVADADHAAREALARGSDGLARVVAAFGDGVLQPDGSLDRPAMRRRVFADADARRRLESIVHPIVRATLQLQCAEAASPYAIAAIPLLAEGGGREAYPWIARILVVDVPAEVQIERLLHRDGIDRALAESMVSAQATREARLAIADDVIVNTGTLQELDRHVAALHGMYLALAGAG